jgi:hypothetical protein
MLLIAVLGLLVGLLVGQRSDRSPAAGLDDATRYAVLLLNGQVFFGTPVRSRFESIVGGPLRLVDVYYVQTQVNPETRESRNILVKRGNEWHSPVEMRINPAHVLIVEPVGAGSSVDDLIRKLQPQTQSVPQK